MKIAYNDVEFLINDRPLCPGCIKGGICNNIPCLEFSLYMRYHRQWHNRAKNTTVSQILSDIFNL